MKPTHQAYAHLLSLSREAQLLNAIDQLLQWDQETYMPPAAAQSRAEQIELLSKLYHERRTSKEFRKTLDSLISIDNGTLRVKGLSKGQQAALREWRRDFIQEEKLPTRFVQALAKLSSESTVVWRLARQENAFIKFAPYLERLIDMSRQKAEYLGYTDHPYDALLDKYEPDMTTRKVATIFNRLKDPLCALRNRVLSKKRPKTDFLNALYPYDKQMAFSHELLQATGYHPERARLDITTHPFCSVPHPLDGRITTRVDLHEPMTNFGATLHEGGHYLYEANLPLEHYGSPLGQPISMAIHESQSRWWETLIGQSKAFWEHFFPLMKKTFPKQLNRVTLQQFYAAINIVSLTPIRIESDEVSYPLHIILRFELECDLIEGELKVRDIPEAWNEKMQAYLGMTPKNDAQGCLQDIHWSIGSFGYFPTYALGNLYAAQFFQAFANDFPRWEQKIAKGDCAFVRDWLKIHIHQYGRTYTGPELVKRITGKTLSSDAYMKYLTKKYSQLYRLSF